MEALLTKSEQNAVFDLAGAMVNNMVLVVQCRDRNTGEVAPYLTITEHFADGSVRATPVAKVIGDAYSHLEPLQRITVLDLQKV